MKIVESTASEKSVKGITSKNSKNEHNYLTNKLSLSILYGEVYKTKPRNMPINKRKTEHIIFLNHIVKQLLFCVLRVRNFLWWLSDLRSIFCIQCWQASHAEKRRFFCLYTHRIRIESKRESHVVYNKMFYEHIAFLLRIFIAIQTIFELLLKLLQLLLLFILHPGETYSEKEKSSYRSTFYALINLWFHITLDCFSFSLMSRHRQKQ